MVTRRKFIKTSAMAGAATMMPWGGIRKAFGVTAAPGLSDPALQPKFVEMVPNALAPGFIFQPQTNGPLAGKYNIAIRPTVQQTGLRKNGTGKKLNTEVWGYGGDDWVSWPGRTFQVQSGAGETEVKWDNQLFVNKHLLPVDTSVHWAYSLPGYEQYSIRRNGVPIVTHLHGGNSDFQYDGNPEFFWSPDYEIVGPQWANTPYGFEQIFKYNNDVPAGNLWYHDHALGITRLNVYAGLAGFYFVRDNDDTGTVNNSFNLPAYPYELAYAIQDRMFTRNGALFYPAFPGDPFWADFIDDGMGGGAVVENGGDPDLVPRPSALAEFFGDHMVVNGLIWPKANVEPRNYRMRLLNGCDSRFLVIQFCVAGNASNEPTEPTNSLLNFWVVGSDQGLAGSATETDTLVIEPGGRYDIVVDFGASGLNGKRIIMKNIGGDEPFGGDIPGPQVFGETDRVMAFDVVLPLNMGVPESFNGATFSTNYGVPGNYTTRRVALFEGQDEFGRLQPLLGTVSALGSPDPSTTALTWSDDATETPGNGDTEMWEIYNFTEDAHPIHLHLVNFEVKDRNEITFEEAGTQTIVQHNGETGSATQFKNIQVGDPVMLGDEYVENAPKDMVTALPGQVTRIKTHFNKTGRYVWHCHILSHEDHEMMRVLEVG